MKNKHDYYRILHVQPDAPREIIRSSYRVMMQKMHLHPDLGGDDKDATIINEAYAILANPENRAAYDKTRQSPEPFRPSRKTLGESAYSSPLPRHRCAFCRVLNECDTKVSAATFCRNCQSPLFLAQQVQVEDSGRRAITRVPKEHPLIFCTHWPQSEPCSGRTSDISLKGMKFRSSTGLPLGQIIKIDTQVLRAVAGVTRSQRESTGWAIGVQFISLCFEQSRGSFIMDHA